MKPLKESWRPIVGEGYDGYEVSDLGRVRSYRRPGRAKRFSPTPKLRKLVPDRRGYLHVMLCVHRCFVLRKVHHLVLEAFVGPRKPGEEARHEHGPADNRLTSLSWGTPVQNYADKIRHGHHQYGERNPFAKLTDKQAAEIRKSPELLRVLAVKYGVAESTISRIRNRVRRAV